MTERNDSPTPVEDLLARARAYVTHSHAKNTLDAYAADWKHFSGWCDDGVAWAVKRALTALEVDTEDYSGHSLRAGRVRPRRWPG
jgi:hypothetical protein